MFHRLGVRRVIAETADARSFVLDVPGALSDAFRYDAGQFCTFRVEVGGRALLRCYSMSSSPDVDEELAVTVKRVPGGEVSNWMIDRLGPGDVVEVTPPAGVFRLGPGDEEIVAFAGGSGITPVLSIVKTALATTSRRVRLLYANRDRGAVIFRRAIDQLADRHLGRFEVTHHYDTDAGVVTAEEARSFAGSPGGAEFYLCGPQPFMDLVDGELRTLGVADRRIHVERFGPLPAPPPPPPATSGERRSDAAPDISVRIRLDGRTAVASYHPGTTILQTARQAGMSPPSSCEAGDCATCMARLVEGTASMRANNALTEEEVAEGWVLTCQAVPTSSSVEVIYDDGPM